MSVIIELRQSVWPLDTYTQESMPGYKCIPVDQIHHDSAMHPWPSLILNLVMQTIYLCKASGRSEYNFYH
jgi:hypothetical protein